LLLLGGGLFGALFGHTALWRGGWWLLHGGVMLGGVLPFFLLFSIFLMPWKRSGRTTPAAAWAAGQVFLGALVGMPCCLLLLQLLSPLAPRGTPLAVGAVVGGLVGLLTWSLWPAGFLASQRRHERRARQFNDLFSQAFMAGLLRSALEHEQKGEKPEAEATYRHLLEWLRPGGPWPVCVPDLRERLRLRIVRRLEGAEATRGSVQWLVGFAALALAAVAFWWLSGPLSKAGAWRDLGHPDDTTRSHAADVLAGMAAADPTIVPRLVADLRDPDPHLRMGAADALGRVGPPALPAAREMAQLLAREDDPRVINEVDFALPRLGPAAAAGAAGLLGDSRPEVRRRAANALFHFGPAGRSAAPPLVAALRDPDAKVRDAAAEALGQVGGDAAVEGLLGALGGPAGSKALQAVEQLGVDAAPALKRALSVGPEGVRCCAAGLLLRMRPSPLGEQESRRLQLTYFPDPEDPRQLPELAKLGPAGRQAVPELLGWLKAHRFDVRTERSDRAHDRVIETLGALGDPRAVPGLLDLASLAGPGRRVKLRTALEKILTGPLGADALPQLTRAADPPFTLLDDGFREVRATLAVEALGAAGPGREVQAALLKVAQGGVSKARQVAAVRALGRAGRGAEDAVVPFLLKLVPRGYRDKGEVSAAATEALAALGAGAVPPLREAVNSKDAPTRALAARLLGSLGPTARPAVPELRAALISAPPDVRNACAAALARIDPKSLPDLQWLRLGLQTDDTAVQDRGLAAVAQRGEKAVPALLAGFAGSSPTARHAAELLLSRVPDADVKRMMPGLLAALETPGPTAPARPGQAGALVPAQQALLALRDRAIPDLLKAVKGGSALRRKRAVGVLAGVRDGRQGVWPPAVVEAVQGALRQASKDDDAGVRQIATEALKRWASPGQKADLPQD
jgi:HEAT repeat protein